MPPDFLINEGAANDAGITEPSKMPSPTDGVDGPQRHRCAIMRVVRTGNKGAARDEH